MIHRYASIRRCYARDRRYHQLSHHLLLDSILPSPSHRPLRSCIYIYQPIETLNPTRCIICGRWYAHDEQGIMLSVQSNIASWGGTETRQSCGRNRMDITHSCVNFHCILQQRILTLQPKETRQSCGRNRMDITHSYVNFHCTRDLVNCAQAGKPDSGHCMHKLLHMGSQLSSSAVRYMHTSTVLATW
jgi:hypothetical protein